LHLNKHEATANEKCLTDGRNFLWVYCDEEGLVSSFSRYGSVLSISPPELEWQH